MNKEAQFGLRFVVKDLAKMRKAMTEMNKNLEKMQGNANKASKGVDKISGSFGKATKSVLKFAAAYFALSKIIGTVFSKANETLQAQLMATTAGIQVSQIKRFGKALKEFGGDARSAGAAYASLTNIIGGAKHGFGISEDVQRVNAMYGIGFNYGNISQDQLLTNIATSMHRLRGKGDQWAINQIANAYGLDDSISAMLAKHGANWKGFVSKQQIDDMGVSDARKLVKAQDDIKTKMDSLFEKLVPFIDKGLDFFMKAIDYLEHIGDTWMGQMLGYESTEQKQQRIQAEKDEAKRIQDMKDYIKASGIKTTGNLIGDYYNAIGKVKADTTAKVNASNANYWMDYLKNANFDAREMAHISPMIASQGGNLSSIIGKDGITVKVQFGDVILEERMGNKAKVKYGTPEVIIEK